MTVGSLEHLLAIHCLDMVHMCVADRVKDFQEQVSTDRLTKWCRLVLEVN